MKIKLKKDIKIFPLYFKKSKLYSLETQLLAGDCDLLLCVTYRLLSTSVPKIDADLKI